MRPNRTMRPRPGGPRWRPWRPRRARGAAPLRCRWQPALAPVLIWLVATLLAAPTALALAVTADAPSAVAGAPRPQGPGAGPSAEPLPAGRVPPLRPPVAGPLVRGFEAPAGRFGPGHRGVDLASPPAVAVRAPARGRVVFAGSVAGTVWVSVEVGPGVVATFGPLRALVVARGQQVAAGTQVAELAPGHGSPGHPATLHLGLRVDGEYVDPFPWLTGFGRPRLAPLLEPGGPH
jgi:murein DD-endopeptidase MepM/ murein hydrolase activator NlpD